ncbi:MAG: tetratricopeptide repeat protein, partial [Marinifilum sp.]|nr:tetratricopeptide repeat protein [Marinifilum sp.]
YKYNEAITLLETNLNNIEYYSVYLNLLQHQRQDVKVRNHINALKTNYMEYENDENYIVILRNSGHLFNYETSSLNLRKCIKYFKSVNSHFGRATSLNNLGIVYLYNSDNETALKCFVEAKIIFEELYSNEVYQAIFNIGVYYLVRNEYGTALSYFNDAISTLPQLLGYDLCKFKNNKSICEFFNGELNLNQLVALFEDLQKQALDIPDPWAQFQLQYNLGSLIFLKDRDYGQKLKIKATNNYPGDPSIYGIRKVFIVDSVEIDLILSISPHWRY